MDIVDSGLSGNCWCERTLILRNINIGVRTCASESDIRVYDLKKDFFLTSIELSVVERGSGYESQYYYLSLKEYQRHVICQNMLKQ